MAIPPIDLRNAARTSILGAIVVAMAWVIGMGVYTLAAPGLAGDFRAHLTAGLAMFSILIVVPLLLLMLSLNWVVRRIAGALVALLFLGMTRGGFAQGFGLIADLGIVFVCGILVGSILFFLSRPSVMEAVGDFYSFLSMGDVLSTKTLHRVPNPDDKH